MLSNWIRLARDGPVAVLSIDKPETLNAFDLEMAHELAQRTKEVAKDEGVRALLVRGGGKHFCAGGDLAAISEASDPSAYVLKLARTANVALDHFRTMAKPVLAELKGAVAGGGVGVALAADLRIASDTTKISLAFLKVGLTPDMGATWALPRMVGRGRAFELASAHDPIDANEAHRLGIVNRVVAHADLEAKSLEWARTLAQLPPLAVGELKALLTAGEAQPFYAQVEQDSAAIARMAGTADFREGVQAFFDKRPPQFKGQ